MADQSSGFIQGSIRECVKEALLRPHDAAVTGLPGLSLCCCTTGWVAAVKSGAGNGGCGTITPKCLELFPNPRHHELINMKQHA